MIGVSLVSYKQNHIERTILADLKGHLKSRQRLKISEDCSKTTARESDPGLRRSKEAQELLNGKGDLTEDEEEE